MRAKRLAPAFAVVAVFTALFARDVRAHVPDRRPVVIIVDPVVEPLVPFAVLRDAIAAELDVAVIESTPDPSAGPARGVLTITFDPHRRLVVIYRDAEGSVLHRTVALPRGSVAAIELVTLLAGNLIRNEAQDLLEQITPPPVEEPPPPAPAPARATRRAPRTPSLLPAVGEPALPGPRRMSPGALAGLLIGGTVVAGALFGGGFYLQDLEAAACRRDVRCARGGNAEGFNKP